MHKLLSLLIALGIALPSFSTGKINDSITPLQNDSKRTTWIWHTKDITENSQDTVNFLISQNVSRVYLQIHYSLDFETYRSFIKTLSENNIEAFALDGAPKWVHSMKYLDRMLAWVELYNHSSSENEEFKGIQLDVEPYVLQSWNTDQKEIVKDFEKLIINASTFAKKEDLQLDVVIPFWFDKINASQSSLAEWVIKHTDSTTVMAYRDKAIGRNGILSLSETEVTLAEKYEKEITLAVETNKNSEHTHVSFYEEGRSFMEEIIKIVEEANLQNDSFYGIGVHDYSGWKELK
jgi:hypothetical protein